MCPPMSHIGGVWRPCFIHFASINLGFRVCFCVDTGPQHALLPSGCFCTICQCDSGQLFFSSLPLYTSQPEMSGASVFLVEVQRGLTGSPCAVPVFEPTAAPILTNSCHPQNARHVYTCFLGCALCGKPWRKCDWPFGKPCWKLKTANQSAYIRESFGGR